MRIISSTKKIKLKEWAKSSAQNEFKQTPIQEVTNRAETKTAKELQIADEKQSRIFLTRLIATKTKEILNRPHQTRRRLN